MAQHTAQKLEKLTVVKLKTEILIGLTQQITKFMLIQKQRLAGPP